MTKQEIMLNYQNALSRADEIDEAADRLHRIRTDRITAAENDMQAAWTGDNADRCTRKIRIFREELESREKSIRKLANALRKMARTFYMAEIAALKIAEARKY